MKGFYVEQNMGIPVFYKGVKVGDYFADLMVNDLIILELKAVENLRPIHEVQLVNYLAGPGLISDC